MNILMINYEYPPAGGGAGRAVAMVARELVGLGHDVQVLASRGAEASDTVEHGVRLRLVPTARRGVHDAGTRAILEFMVRAARELPRLIRQRERVICHYFFSVPVGVLSLRHKSTPSVVSLRGGDIPGYAPGEYPTISRLLLPLNRRVLRSAGRVVALSEDLKIFAAKLVPGVDMDVIHNGVDSALFSPPEDPPGGNDQVRLLTVGRFVKWKGIQDVIAAVQSLNNPSIHLRIAGSGAFEADLRRQVSRNQMGNQVTFAGLVAHENLPSEYRGADIFVLPSRGDSFGQVFTEAMACGLPIIACRARATPEVVADGKGGQLVEPGDVPALAAAIQNLSTNVAARRDMSAFNRQLAVDAFSWHSVASRYTEIYQSVLA